ncbi:uncharacterized protein ISCGN_020907 [Ixodes scapularis]
MQETNVKDPRLSAYNYFHNPAIERKYTKTGPPEARGLATVYLKGTVPHAQIDTQKWCTPDQEVTAVRTLIDNHKLILVSAYVRPTAEDPNFSWIEELRTVYPDDRIVIDGDFNAHHREWGYDDDDQRGARLLEAYEKAGLELANDTHEKTRPTSRLQEGEHAWLCGLAPWSVLISAVSSLVPQMIPSSALAAFSTARAPSCSAHSRRWWPVSAYSLQSLAVYVSVPPHVVPAHRDYGTVGPETVDDGRCPDLFLPPLRPFDFRSIQRSEKYAEDAGATSSSTKP